jgi:EAL domain-containing protein (putative c-di-GMP-specific phosphodiesterase class I)
LSDVFIIDDEKQVAEMLAEVVELAGFSSSVYMDARHFFDEKAYSDESIILLDLNMPAMDGVEVIRQLSIQNCRASLILMSGYDMSVLHSAEKLAHAHKLDIISSLTKPIHLNDLLSTLVQHQDTAKSTKIPGGLTFEPDKDDIINALHNNEMELYYQPQIALETGKIIGAEALIRWQHPEHGLLPPGVFIGRAEQYQLMDRLTTSVIDMAVKQLASMRYGDNHFPISINVSADAIRSINLPEQLHDMLRANLLSPKQLALEVTESVLMGELVTSLDILTRLRMKGFTLSIDDFGTGFSSLSLLHKVPFNELKVDRSFVMEMDKDKDAVAIVKTCVMLAKELDMKVVAEGVESAKTLNKLAEMGCDIAQGYHIAKPMPVSEFTAWVEANLKTGITVTSS